MIDVNGMVGFSFQAAKDAFCGQYAPGRLLLLSYAGLTGNPKAAMQAVYKFIGERFAKDSFWKDPQNNIRKVPIV